MPPIYLNTDTALKLIAFAPCVDTHPALSITVRVTRHAHRKLHLDYQLHEMAGSVLWPDSHSTPLRADDLWQHTCMELFIRQKDHQAYAEINLSPLACWNAYAFDHYRSPASLPPRQARNIYLCSLDVTHGRLQALLDFSDCFAADTPLELGLTAVIESSVIESTATEQPHTLSYWALRHSGEHADFHLAQDWIVQTCLLP